MSRDSGWFLLEAIRERRRRKRAKRRRKRRSDACETCDSCDGCDGCFGCDLMIGFTSLGALLGAVPALRTPPIRPVARAGVSPAARGGLALIRGYQRYVSAHTPVRCRFTPSCSEYGAQAVRRYGLADGTRLTADRIRRCTSTTPAGTVDPLR